FAGARSSSRRGIGRWRGADGLTTKAQREGRKAKGGIRSDRDEPGRAFVGFRLSPFALRLSLCGLRPGTGPTPSAPPPLCLRGQASQAAGRKTLYKEDESGGSHFDGIGGRGAGEQARGGAVDDVPRAGAVVL